MTAALRDAKVLARAGCAAEDSAPDGGKFTENLIFIHTIDQFGVDLFAQMRAYGGEA